MKVIKQGDSSKDSTSRKNHSNLVEGNFLRAFVDWIIYNMKRKTEFQQQCGGGSTY